MTKHWKKIVMEHRFYWSCRLLVCNFSKKTLSYKGLFAIFYHCNLFRWSTNSFIYHAALIGTLLYTWDGNLATIIATIGSTIAFDHCVNAINRPRYCRMGIIYTMYISIYIWWYIESFYVLFLMFYVLYVWRVPKK